MAGELADSEVVEPRGVFLLTSPVLVDKGVCVDSMGSDGGDEGVCERVASNNEREAAPTKKAKKMLSARWTGASS